MGRRTLSPNCSTAEVQVWRRLPSVRARPLRSGVGRRGRPPPGRRCPGRWYRRGRPALLLEPAVRGEIRLARRGVVRGVVRADVLALEVREVPALARVVPHRCLPPFATHGRAPGQFPSTTGGAPYPSPPARSIKPRGGAKDTDYFPMQKRHRRGTLRKERAISRVCWVPGGVKVRPECCSRRPCTHFPSVSLPGKDGLPRTLDSGEAVGSRVKTRSGH